MRGVRSEFDRLVVRARRELKRARLRAELPGAVADALPLLAAGGALALLARAGFRGGLDPFSAPVLLAVLGPFAAVLAVRLCAARFAPVSRLAALRALDRAADAGERLVAADAFLAAPARTGFMRATVEDAAARLEHARAAPVAGPARAPFRVASLGWAALAGLLLVAALLVPPRTGEGASETASVRTAMPSAPEPSPARDAAPRPDGDEVARERAKTRRKRPRDDARAGRAERHAADESKAARGTEATSRSGSSAEGGAPSRAARSAGTPSEQGQLARSGRKARRPGKPKPSPEAKSPDAKEQRKRLERRAGGTTGQGSARSSSRNPTTSPWKTRDRPPASDADAAADDEEVEDEDEASEARGGMQPNLRDRKPPVSRDLRIGFGNRPDPEANSRGGPSQRKKSRGTASLVLGVPVPDHVKGTPTPGRTTGTQERGEPRAEKADAVRAGARAPRRRPIGPVADPELVPWMKTLLRRYFDRDDGNDEENE